MTISLKQAKELPSESKFDSVLNWIVVLPKEPTDSIWKKLPYGASMRRRYKRLPAEKRDDCPIVLDLPNAESTHAVLACVNSAASRFEQLTLARQLARYQLDLGPRRIGLCALGFQKEQVSSIVEALIAALLAGAAEMPRCKSKPVSRTALAVIELYGHEDTQRFRRTIAETEGNSLARYLTTLPPNDLTPAKYRSRVKQLAKQYGWRMEFLDAKVLARKKAGAFLAVAQGSPEKDAGIAHLVYAPARRTGRPKLALVGKGICFDTGGVNLKPHKYMLGMHEDMEGSAVALGTFLALSQLKVDFQMECWLALATNHIGPAAYKPNDVVTALDGTTIEIIHTDAEGRMVLADTLALASRAKPDLIIDYATLTGACVYSLGKSYSGAFTNQERLIAPVIEAGRDSGERVWPFPMDKDYDEVLKSDIADVKQCAAEGNADHIVAARFLSRFVKDGIPWLHIDLSSGRRKGGLALIPSDVTGFGIRFSLNLLLDKSIIR